jgi:hypothetical protein
VGALPAAPRCDGQSAHLSGGMFCSESRSAHALSLSHNSGWVFAHVQGLEVCTGLTELNASHNALIDVASSIGSLSELVELNVSHNAIKSWTGFPGLKSLMVCPSSTLLVSQRRLHFFSPVAHALLYFMYQCRADSAHFAQSIIHL